MFASGSVELDVVGEAEDVNCSKCHYSDKGCRACNPSRFGEPPLTHHPDCDPQDPDCYKYWVLLSRRRLKRSPCGPCKGASTVCALPWAYHGCECWPEHPVTGEVMQAIRRPTPKEKAVV